MIMTKGQAARLRGFMNTAILATAPGDQPAQIAARKALGRETEPAKLRLESTQRKKDAL